MSTRIIRLLILAAIIIIPLILLSISSSWIMEWLWLNELGYSQVFWTVRSTQVILTLAAFLIASTWLVYNFRQAAVRIGHAIPASSPLQNLNLGVSGAQFHKRLKQLFTGGALVIAFLFSSAFLLRWDQTIRFLWGEQTGTVDPLFGHDIGFYLFQLPFWELVQTSLTVLAFITLLVVGILYVVSGLISANPDRGISIPSAVKTHLSMIGALWLGLLAWGFYLDRYQLLFRSDGVIFGAGYTHVNVELPALWLLAGLCLLLAILLAASRWVAMKKTMIATAALVVLTLILGRAALPSLVQQFDVDPNELERERPFIENNIEMTRAAYGLDNVQEIDYTTEDTLVVEDIRNNRDIVDNIRLWDPRLLIQTYQQLQEIRPYYQFNNVDIDRYEIGGETQQVMLSARELASQLPSQSDTWVNRHMQYTHGIGLAMSPVNRTDNQGQPDMFVRNIPPVSPFPELQLDNPAIYYGEQSHHYYIVNTDAEELHYPRAGENVYKHYEGRGGIQFSSFWRQLLFAWEMGDINILLSDNINDESRFQIWRGLQERINKVAPFLQLDEDPYLVMNNGQMYWVQDAYTTTSNYPYSQISLGGDNYIRNSVKIVMDAYHGDIDFYITDEEDPLISLYDQALPGMFQSLDQAPDGLQEHFRYPQNLFEVQLELYNRYHMTNPRLFYNNEDRWVRPNEQYAGQRILMEPYYTLARMPHRDRMEFMLMSPVTPENRNNMISWMAANSDPENYGELVSFQLPRERLIYGPSQIEARIDQDPEISRQIALWDQRGSRVIRGNLMVIPIENSFMYVEPVFLLADEDDIPQLQRVIVAIGEEISMQPTIEAALFELFGEEADFLDPVEPADPPIAELEAAAEGDPVASDMPMPDGADMEQVQRLEEIRALWQQLRQAMQEGDWSRYGDLLNELDAMLESE